MPETLRITSFASPDLAVRAAADLFTALAPATVALAGGSTPEALYRLLASDDYRHRTDWEDLRVFFGDERAVPPTHPDSNYGLARRALLDHVPVNPALVHRMEADDPDMEAAADRYALALPAALDVILLGMGPDGHTASLFPGSPLLDEEDRRVAVTTAPNATRRMTLTLPAINASRHVVFLVLGSAKRAALDGVRNGESLPAARVAPSSGDVTWIVDTAAYGA